MQISASAALAASCISNKSLFASKKPNVLFLAVDDWNDWVGCLGGHPDVKTPNLDRLAQSGVLFTNAHCPAPICNPSRTAIMTGLMPSTSGVYNNSQWWRPVLPDVVTLPAYFKNNGYRVEGAGKLFHHMPGFNDPRAWDHYYFWNPEARENGWDERYQTMPPLPPKVPATDIPEHTKPNFDFAPLDVDDDEMADGKVAGWAAEYLKQKYEKPFFLAVGMFRPHIAWYAPRKYFDMYPLDEIELPPVKEDDLDDLPPIAREWALDKGSNHEHVKKSDQWKKAVQAYLACISFSDAQVGKILKALQAGPNLQDTLVVLWSDHGYHLGEKQHWHKFTLWERSTRVPLIFSYPGVITPNTTCTRPVSLLDLYPSLIDFCGLPAKGDLDGRSIAKLVKNPKAEWKYPAITSHGYQNFAVRSEQWRYIRYKDGSEELYDHQNDPNEWNNLASLPEYDTVKKEMAEWIPEKVAPEAPRKGAYKFDPRSYTWQRKRG
ncbi:sulfatase [candidate division KSB1 bacterium]|nr:sulfatase [candidate division KSB1 bacterium]